MDTEVVLEYIVNFASDGGAVLLVTHYERISNKGHRTYKMKEGKFLSE